ncbi:ABC transporter ATP-binding protein [Lysinibacillus agricola]|uniref:ABC transporter ATP-binding protein n=1 Tax=Lysinibacillus agricola TaxID=2590012 RepID=A0ABX7AY37_9BACI|nr:MULTISPECIES: ABC transporter ATP-binding protein [Lysinibacillus]KOS64398.1 multidrug ABC transporter ATP-binding protein [Lysinibacillus sp. FJAT-14222]QQP14741.1 ABC transporter ATP-binding protein [Lysinibacillus agricola]
MIRVENVTYGYGEESILKDISFKEKENGITAVWGRNGAGKTTLMKLLAGHDKPNKGIVEIMGTAPYNRAEVVQSVCYMQEDHPFSSIWNVKDSLRFGQYYYSNWDMDMANRLLKIFRLDENKKISKLSKGMKSALQFIIGISSNAKITILDEPSNGLDANMRKKMYKIIRESQEQHPRLFLVSTHHIEEIQQICDSILVIHDKEVFIHEPIDEIRECGIWLVGDKNTIEKVTDGQYVLEASELGSRLKVMVDVPFNEKWKEIASLHGLSIEKVKLQDYLLNKTEEAE